MKWQIELGIMLLTAKVFILHKGKIIQIRALIDQASQKNLCSLSYTKVPGSTRNIIPLKKFWIMRTCSARHKKNIHFGNTQKKSQNRNRTSRVGTSSVNALFAIIKDQRSQKYYSPLLANPNCLAPAKIDMVIGSGSLLHILLAGLKTCSSLIARNTIFQWISSCPI